MTLLEVLISMAILSLGALFTASVMRGAALDAAKTRQTFDFQSAVATAKHVFGERGSCTLNVLNFSSATIDTTNAAFTIDISRLQGPGVGNPVMMTVNTALSPGLTLTRLQLSGFTPVTVGKTYWATLTMDAVKTNGLFLGASGVTTHFPVQFETNPGGMPNPGIVACGSPSIPTPIWLSGCFHDNVHSTFDDPCANPAPGISIGGYAYYKDPDPSGSVDLNGNCDVGKTTARIRCLPKPF